MLRIEVPSDLHHKLCQTDHLEEPDHIVTITYGPRNDKTACHGSNDQRHDPEYQFYFVADERNYMRTLKSGLSKKRIETKGNKDLFQGKGVSMFVQCSHCLRMYRLDTDIFNWQSV